MQVHYCGTLDDDTIFDSSHEREPLDFIVGSGKVIPGFDDVVIGMVKGERRKERVEPDRAYGEPHQQPYPASSMQGLQDYMKECSTQDPMMRFSTETYS